MTQDEIIEMAKQTGLIDVNYEVGQWDIHEVTTFAKLVAAKEREKVAKWQIGSGYSTGHGETIEDLLVELEWQVRESEREACAKVCEDKNTLLAWPTYAAAIRARGQA